MSTITGLHHVTAIAGDAQENLEFYTEILGMRLVKKTVNQDVPDSYHLFYADAEGHAGSDLTFFPWAGMAPGQPGTGLTTEVALAVPPGSLAYWADRLARRNVRLGELERRFGEPALPLHDTHGLALALVETGDPREFTSWDQSPVPEAFQIRGLHGVRLAEHALAPTVHFLTTTLGFRALGEEAGWRRFALPGARSGRLIDIQTLPERPRGTWGVGSVHHIAWRVPDDDAQRAVADRIRASGRHPTEVIDRFWFKSVYFKEPGGALFEIATDGPGFTIDEAPNALGGMLILPPWLEPHRAEIERALPPLADAPARGSAGWEPAATPAAG